MSVSLESTTELKIGDKAPDFTLIADDGTSVSLSDLNGQKIILYFYPKDDTPGCTQQACDFRNHHAELVHKNVCILGVSKDQTARHQKFKQKYQLPFRLLTDSEGTVCQKYGVWQKKWLYGKMYYGIERSTFLIDETGHLQKIWRKVKVPQHVQDILKLL